MRSLVSGRSSAGVEDQRRQAVSVEQVGPGSVLVPGLLHGNRLRHIRAGNDHAVAVDHGLSPVILTVFAGHGELLQAITVLGSQSLTDVGELNANLVILNFVRGVDRTVDFDILCLSCQNASFAILPMPHRSR